MDESGNPLDWLTDFFALQSTRKLFDLYADDVMYAAVTTAVDALGRRYPSLRVRRCLIHGMFAPFHVLVTGVAIYVIDLASCRPGYAVQDIACFITFRDTLLPWRRIPALRTDMIAQHRRFLEAYFGTVGRPEEYESDRALLALARIQAIFAYAGHLEARDTFTRFAYSTLARPFMRQSVNRVCRSELKCLSDL
jgi:Ser/Thr protein kinase RdoA (MazF antagonist)